MSAERSYLLLADATLVLHVLFVLFVVGGQLLILAGWIGRWVWVRGMRFRLLHLGAIAFVVLEAWFGVVCPLTTLENALRVRGGANVYQQSFVGDWLHRLLFYQAPSWVFTIAYTLFGLLVLICFFGYPPRRGSARAG